ncbi:MAG: rubrerythrin [Acutalibacteraceae bacterium]|nr:rubrerythrin [Acutalibacteraceae bacterium]
MSSIHEVKINTRDRLLRAWENSMQLVREFKVCEKEIEDNEQASQMFGKFAEEEGVHASKFKDMLLDLDKN